MNTENKKKLPLGVRLLLLPVKIILVLLLILILWFAFCRFDHIKPADALPPAFTFYLRTDKIWNTAEPLLNLDATLVAMSSPELQNYREPYLKLKSSKLRNNPLIKFALRRRFDAAVYAGDDSSDFICVLDSGAIAGATRLLPFFLPKIKALDHLQQASKPLRNLLQPSQSSRKRKLL